LADVSVLEERFVARVVSISLLSLQIKLIGTQLAWNWPQGKSRFRDNTFFRSVAQ